MLNEKEKDILFDAVVEYKKILRTEIWKAKEEKEMERLEKEIKILTEAWKKIK